MAAAALAPAGCGRKAELPPDLFPQSFAPGWALTQTGDLAASDTPDPVPRNSIDGIRAATYQNGAAEIRARVYLLSSPDIGAALGARWRPSADTVFFDRGPYFVVVKWQAAARADVQQFVAGLQKRLGAAAPAGRVAGSPASSSCPAARSTSEHPSRDAPG